MELFQDTMECPKCGRKGLVKQSNDVYQCLWCRFRRDLSESDPVIEFILLLILAFLAVTLIRLVQPEEALQNEAQQSYWLEAVTKVEK